MAQQVVSGASLMCSFGAGPGTLTVLPTRRVNAGGPPAATARARLGELGSALDLDLL